MLLFGWKFVFSFFQISHISLHQLFKYLKLLPVIVLKLHNFLINIFPFGLSIFKILWFCLWIKHSQNLISVLKIWDYTIISANFFILLLNYLHSFFHLLTIVFFNSGIFLNNSELVLIHPWIINENHLLEMW